MMHSHFDDKHLSSVVELTTKDVEIQLPVHPSTQFYYIQGLPAEALTKLQKKYPGKLPVDFEKHCQNNRTIYWLHFGEYCAALGNNLIFTFYLIVTGSDGIKYFVNVFTPQDPPDMLVKLISTSLATLSGLLFTFAFLPGPHAAKDTIDYAERPRLRERADQFFSELKQTPGKTSLNALAQLIDESILLTTNVTVNAVYVIGLNTLLDIFNLPNHISLSILMLYLGEVYANAYSNPNYKEEGLSFLKNENNYPWVVSELKLNDLTLPIATILQGIGINCLPAFPIGYALALSVEETLGWWFNPIFISVLIFFRSVRILYPTTYLEMFGSRIKMNAQIEKILEPKINEMLQNLSALHLSSSDVEKIKKILIRSEREKLVAEIEKEQQCGFLIKHQPLSIMTLIFQGSVGGYLGYQLLGFLGTGPMVAGVIAGSLLFYQFHRRAEEIRLREQLACQRLEEKERTHVDNPKEYSCTTRVVAMTLNAGTAASSAISCIGLTNATKGLNSPSVIPIVSYFSLARMFNMLSFNAGKILPTIDTIFQKLGNCFRHREIRVAGAHATLFKSRDHLSSQNVPAKTSWCCFRKR